MLERDKSAGIKVTRRVRDDGAYAIQPLGTRRQRLARLEAQVAALQMRIAVSDIRRIGDDHVKSPIA